MIQNLQCQDVHSLLMVQFLNTSCGSCHDRMSLFPCNTLLSGTARFPRWSWCIVLLVFPDGPCILFCWCFLNCSMIYRIYGSSPVSDNVACWSLLLWVPLVGRHVDSLGDVNFYHQSLTTWSFLAQKFFYATY